MAKSKPTKSKNIHIVKKNENLSTIAQQDHIPLKELLSTPGNEAYNKNPDLIHEGDVVYLGDHICTHH